MSDTPIPAFPVQDVPHEAHGMAMRDYFAAKAMQSVATYRRESFLTDNEYEMDWDTYYDSIAQESYAIADAMLKTRGEA